MNGGVALPFFFLTHCAAQRAIERLSMIRNETRVGKRAGQNATPTEK